jgi:phage tail protein
MAVGICRFGMFNGGHQKHSRSASYRWRALDRIGRAPAQHYGGPGVQDITLEGVIYPHFKGGLHQVNLMRATAGTGKPMMMVDGLGWEFKQRVNVRVEEKKTYLMADGAPHKIEFSMTLRSSGKDLL